MENSAIGREMLEFPQSRQRKMPSRYQKITNPRLSYSIEKMKPTPLIKQENEKDFKDRESSDLLVSRDHEQFEFPRHKKTKFKPKLVKKKQKEDDRSVGFNLFSLSQLAFIQDHLLKTLQDGGQHQSSNKLPEILRSFAGLGEGAGAFFHHLADAWEAPPKGLWVEDVLDLSFINSDAIRVPVTLTMQGKNLSWKNHVEAVIEATFVSSFESFRALKF